VTYNRNGEGGGYSRPRTGQLASQLPTVHARGKGHLGTPVSGDSMVFKHPGPDQADHRPVGRCGNGRARFRRLRSAAGAPSLEPLRPPRWCPGRRLVHPAHGAIIWGSGVPASRLDADEHRAWLPSQSGPGHRQLPGSQLAWPSEGAGVVHLAGCVPGPRLNQPSGNPASPSVILTGVRSWTFQSDHGLADETAPRPAR